MTTPNTVDPNMTPGQQPGTAAPITSNVAPQMVQPEPVTPPVVPPQHAARYSQLEVDQRVEQARQQEKAKLYSQIESLTNDVNTLRAQIAQRPTTSNEQVPNANAAELEQLRQMVGEMQGQLGVVSNTLAQAEAQRYAAELKLYMTERIEAYKEAGYGLVTEMIGGSTPQEIEQSIQNAAAAYQRYTAQRTPAPVAVVTAQRPAVPNGFPTAPNAPAVPGQDPAQLGFFENVHAATDPDAMRADKGKAYAQQRAVIHQQLRQFGGNVSGAMSNQPRYMPQPGAQPPSTWQGVQQPQGIPTPQVQQPQQMQQWQQPQQPPQMQMQPQQMQWPAPPQMQQMPMQPQWQPQMPGQPQMPAPVIDIASARQQAKEVATRHLANPAAVHNPLPNGKQFVTHGEFRAQPNVSASFADGAHPMVRNTSG